MDRNRRDNGDEKIKTIAIADMRPNRLAGYDSRKYTKVMKQLEGLLGDLAGKEGLRVVSSGGQGLPQLAFWAAMRLKRTGMAVETQIIVPFAGRHLAWNQNGTFGQEEYLRMLSMADSIKLLSPALALSPDSVKEASDKAYARMDAQADLWIVPDKEPPEQCKTPVMGITIEKKGGLHMTSVTGP